MADGGAPPARPWPRRLHGRHDALGRLRRAQGGTRSTPAPASACRVPVRARHPDGAAAPIVDGRTAARARGGGRAGRLRNGIMLHGGVHRRAASHGRGVVFKAERVDVAACRVARHARSRRGKGTPPRDDGRDPTPCGCSAAPTAGASTTSTDGVVAAARRELASARGAAPEARCYQRRRRRCRADRRRRRRRREPAPRCVASTHRSSARTRRRGARPVARRARRRGRRGTPAHRFGGRRRMAEEKKQGCAARRHDQFRGDAESGARRAPREEGQRRRSCRATRRRGGARRPRGGARRGQDGDRWRSSA